MIEQLSGYFADFGEAVSFGTATGTGIVDAAVDEYGRALAAAVVVTVVAADFPAVAAGQAAAIRGASYTVRSVEPDGSGIATVRVSKP